jgi:hypothetical protein
MAPFRATPIVLSPFGEQLAALAGAAVAIDRLGEPIRQESPA